MTMLCLTGEKFNLLERVAAANITVDHEDADWPRPALYDGRLIRPFRSGAGSSLITVDANLILNGTMETAGGSGLLDWTEANTGTGDVTRTTVAGEFLGGIAGAKLAAGSGTAVMYQEITARAGEKITLFFSAKSDGTTLVHFKIYNVTLGRWLQGNGAGWQNTETDATAYSVNGWGSGTLTFTVEDMATQNPPYAAPLVTLRVVISVETATKTGYVDDIALCPAVNFVSVHGHNHSYPSQQILSSTNNFSTSTVVASPTATYQAYYAKLATDITARWIRMAINSNPSSVATAELVMSQYQMLSRGPVAPRISAHVNDGDRAQVRAETGAGDTYVFSRSAFERRTVHLPFFTDDTAMRAMIQDIHRRSEGGLWPMVIVPDDSKPDVIYGRIEAARSVRHTTRAGAAAGRNWHQQDLVVRELALPQLAL